MMMAERVDPAQCNRHNQDCRADRQDRLAVAAQLIGRSFAMAIEPAFA